MASVTSFLFPIFLLCSWTSFASAITKNAPGKIRAALITPIIYDRFTEPYSNESNKQIPVTIDVALNQIIGMDDKHEILTTALWMRLRWTDQNINWTPASYGNVTLIRASQNEIWVPDITVYNDVRNSIFDTTKNPITISNTGSALWLYPLMLKSTCKLDMTYFPFDQQICKIKFGSWSYDGGALNLLNYTTTGDVSNLVNNSNWDIMSFTLRRHNIKYGCCPNPFPDVTYYIIMRRKSLHYVLNHVVPCIVIMLIVLFGFYLPPASQERITLGVTCQLALVVFLLIVAEELPAQSDSIPLIQRFYGGTTALLAISLICYIASLRMYHVTDVENQKPPQWLRYLAFNILAPLACQCKIYKRMKTSEGCLGESSSGYSVENVEISQVSGGNRVGDGKSNAVNDGDIDENRNEWQLIAISFDRFMGLLIGLVYAIVSLVILLYRPDYNMDPESKKGY